MRCWSMQTFSNSSRKRQEYAMGGKVKLMQGRPGPMLDSSRATSKLSPGQLLAQRLLSPLFSSPNTMSALRTASAASQALRSSSLRVKPCACVPARLAVPPTPLSARPFSSSPSLLKKSKTQPAKPSKGKVRNEGDPSETDVDVKGALDKTGVKMQKAAEWAKTQVWEGVERARGRVSPGMSPLLFDWSCGGRVLTLVMVRLRRQDILDLQEVQAKLRTKYNMSWRADMASPARWHQSHHERRRRRPPQQHRLHHRQAEQPVRGRVGRDPRHW